MAFEEFLTTVTKELISSSILVPIVWFFLRWMRKYNEDIVATMKEGFNDLKKSFDGHIRHQNEFIKEKLSKTTLTKDQALTIIRERMWYYSAKKLEFLEDVLIRNNFKGRKTEIKKKIKYGLLNISSQYERSLNEFLMPCGQLGDLVKKNFNFEEFFKELIDIVFKDYSEYSDNKMSQIKLKLNDIKTLMSEYQNDLIETLEKKRSENL